MSDQPMTAYCVKCKEHREMTQTEPTYTKTGTPGTRGVCVVCGTKMFKMGATPAHEGIPKPVIENQPVKPKKASAKKTTKAKGKKKKAAPRKRRTGKLVIVESPAKASSIGRYLGKGYTVKASKGHVRDLLRSRLSVDVDNDFEPEYRVPNDKRATVKDLRADVDGADEVYLATDPDREGEAIAWHLISATDLDVERTPIHRVVFHEITKPAIQDAFSHPRDINMDLVNAQQARRILDRLVGYKLTPLLWDKVQNYLSAGRVQSVALRLIVERENEIQAFNSEEYWTVEAQMQQVTDGGKPFVARLLKIDGENPSLSSEAEVKPHLEQLQRSQYQVDAIKRGTRRRKPAVPFTTSTLQQESSRRLNMTTNRTMQIAQRLYEGIDIGGADGIVGLITYMRTDSTSVSKQAQDEARQYIREIYGDDFMPEKPRVYKTKSKGAQEAHEAIRPTSVSRTPDSIKNALLKQDNGRTLLRLYTLIWQRFIASQMSDAIYNTLRVDIFAGLQLENRPYHFRVSGSTIKFKGFLAVYEETRDEDTTVDEDEGRIIPEMQEGELLDLLKLLPEQHFTQPPPRYTEATLIRTLEEYGIGRPSTYAPTVRVIQDRDYVSKENKRLVPTETGQTVINLLVDYFPDVLDFSFTAKMEDRLDQVADGQIEWRPMLHEFYTPFFERLQLAEREMPVIKKQVFVGRACPSCEDGELIVKTGRFGKFIGCSNYPECTYTERYVELTGLACPKCGESHGGEIVGGLRTKRGRSFYGCSRYPDCDFTTWNLPKAPKEENKGHDEQVASPESKIHPDAS